MYLISIVAVFSFLAACYFAVPFGIKYILRALFLIKIPSDEVAYLTFDDGPDPDYTDALLDVLHSHNVKASFFVLGSKIADNPDILVRMVDDGHLIGEHGFRHLHPWKSAPTSFMADMLKMHRTFKAVNGNNPIRYYRPTYGKLNLINLIYLSVFRKRVIFWNLDPEDYNCADSDNIVEFIEQNIRPGSVILLHDGRNEFSKYPADITVKAVTRIIEILKNSGYDFKTVDEIYKS